MKKLISFSTLYAVLLIPALACANSAPMDITTLPAKKLAIYPKYDAPASVISDNNALISAEIQGRILKLPFKVGDIVDKNTVLAVIDCQDTYSQLKQTQAQIKGTQAKKELLTWQVKQMEALVKENNISQERLKTLKAELNSVEALLTQHQAQESFAKHQTQKCEIRAPFTALILEKHASIGELANPGKNILRLLDSQNIELQAHIHASELELIQSSSKIVFETQDKRYPVHLRGAVLAYDSRTRTQEVRFTFDSEKPLTGSVGRLVWYTNKPHLPSQFLSQIDRKIGVFVEDKGKAKFVTLQQALEGRPAPITDLNQNIIINGRYKVTENAPVKAKQHTDTHLL